MRKLLIVLLALLLMAGLPACQPRGGSEPKQKGARENVVIEENPRLSPDDVPREREEEREEEAPEKDARPEELVRGMLEAVKTGDRDAIQKYIDYDALFSSPDGHADNWHYRHVLQSMKYQVLSSDVEDDSASVWVKITNIDMGVVLPEFFNGAMRLEYDNALSDEPVSAAELESEYRSLFKGLVETNKNGVIERLADVTVKKTGDEWKIIPQKDLSNALLGGYLSVRNALGEGAGMAPQTAEQPVKSEEPLQMQPERPSTNDDFFLSQIDGDMH